MIAARDGGQGGAPPAPRKAAALLLPDARLGGARLACVIGRCMPAGQRMGTDCWAQGGSIAGGGGDNHRATARVQRDRSTRARGTAGRNHVRPASSTLTCNCGQMVGAGIDSSWRRQFRLLGILGYVDRAWIFQFSGIEDVKSQQQLYEDVFGQLLQGKRAGDAADQFNIIQGDRAMALTEERENIKFGKIVSASELARLWAARNDARSLAWLGDPACRLPFDAR